MKKNNIKKKNLLFIITLILFGCVLGKGIINYNSQKEKIDINEILETNSYSYLPKEAKTYIKDVYEKTGEVILTEKNKEENVPYLNPQYVTYLQLSDEKKSSVSLIPNPYSVDYVFDSSNISSQEFPKFYNLENVDGKNYTSPMYDQGGLGTCWAFATIENAESHLMIKKNEPRNENSTRFSVRQLDYAASTNGIKGYENPYGVAELGLGGNFIYATTLMANGLSLVDDDYMPYVETLNEKPLDEIHNYSNSLYEVNSTVNLPNFGKIEMEIVGQCDEADDWEVCYDEKAEELRQAYINIIKEGITNYGGIYVGAYDPTGVCGALNTDGYYVLDPNAICFPMGSTVSAETGHAMQIIGWNDDYEYSYCRKSTHSSTVDGACTSGKLTQGTGAWLVKNSWGESDAEYIYLTYDAIQSNYVDFAYITSLTEMKNKNWDNVYNNGKISSSITNKLTQTFEKKFDNQEKIQKIKFHTILMNQQYSISVQINGNIHLITDSYQTEYPGLYTVDVSDKNIFIESGDFDVIITGSERSINENSISVFTKNVDSEQYIFTEEKDVESNKFTLYSETRNILSNTEIEYELYKGNEKLENVMQVNNNIVAANNINAEITLIKKLEPGSYKLVQKNNYIKVTTSLNIGTILDGAGTEDNPFKIYTEEDLKYIHTHLDSYYKLENDIELTSEWVPIGTEDNPFIGAFDGNNRKIINLQINDLTLEYAGLFGYVKDSSEHQTYIKNIYLVNPNILANHYVGGLIGRIYITQTGTKKALIDSIYIIGGNIEGEIASGLVADIYGPFKELTINNIFSSATIKGKSESNLIGISSTYYSNNKGISISNIQNIGVMYDNNLSYYKTSLISANSSNDYSLSNYISTGYSKKINSINQFYDTPIHDIDYDDEINGYVLSRSDSTYTFPDIIKKVNDITELKKIDKYSEWGDNFNTYWEFNEEDGVARIPTLKGVDLDYTESIDDISVEFGNDIALSDYISSELITRRLNVTTEDNDIIEISKEYNPSEAYPHEIIISPLKQGTATMHVVSDYDGFEKDITITVYKTELNITYHNDSDTVVQTITNGSTVNLIKNTFEKEWYTFVGWNTKADGTGTYYIDDQEVTITDDLDLYAQWERKTVKISFDANGGILDGTGVMEDIIVPVSDYMTVSVPYSKFIKEGYKMSSWNTKPDGSGKRYLAGGVITPTNDITLYAQWEPLKYIVTFHANEGQGTVIGQLFNHNSTDKLSKNTFTREGYIFKEWNTKADGTGTSYVDEQEVTITDDLDLYAQWEINKYTVTFNSNNDSNDTFIQEFKYNTDTKLNKNTFTRDGYVFKNWNTKSDGTGSIYSDEQLVSVIDNVSLYAQWEPINYKIVFNANGGSGSMDEQNIHYDLEVSLNSNGYTRVNYKFVEWNTKPDGSGITYLDEQIIKNLSNKSDDVITLYAIWEKDYDYLIDEYLVDEDNKFIYLSGPNTSLESYRTNITLKDGYTLEVDLNGKSSVFTGSKTKIYNGDTLIIEFTNIVKGDVTGDGNVNIADVIKVADHTIKGNILTNDYELKAVDVTGDNIINIADVIKIADYTLDKNINLF